MICCVLKTFGHKPIFQCAAIYTHIEVQKKRAQLPINKKQF